MGVLDQRALDLRLASPWTDRVLLLTFAAAGILVLGSIIAARRFLLRGSGG